MEVFRSSLDGFRKYTETQCKYIKKNSMDIDRVNHNVYKRACKYSRELQILNIVMKSIILLIYLFQINMCYCKS